MVRGSFMLRGLYPLSTQSLGGRVGCRVRLSALEKRVISSPTGSRNTIRRCRFCLRWSPVAALPSSEMLLLHTAWGCSNGMGQRRCGCQWDAGMAGNTVQLTGRHISTDRSRTSNWTFHIAVGCDRLRNYRQRVASFPAFEAAQCDGRL
jgi:hypothetical protein